MVFVRISVHSGIVCSVESLNNIQKTDDQIILGANTGRKNVKQQGYLEGYGWIWFYNKVLKIFLNTIFFNEVTFDSAYEDEFKVYKNKFILKYFTSKNVLYQHATVNRKTKILNTVA